MPPIGNIEWLNQNAVRAYPFRENADMIPRDSAGNRLVDAKIPTGLVVDFIITVPGPLTPRIYLSKLTHIGGVMSFVFSDQDDRKVASTEVDLREHRKYAAYSLTGLGTYDDVRGTLVLGDTGRINVNVPEGIYVFTLDSAEFEPATVRPAIRGVRSLQLSNQGAETDYIYGHVKLVAGNNIRLTYLEEYNAIRIDAIEGAGLNEVCDCVEELGLTNVTRTINGIPIEDVIITGDGQCVDVSISGNRIVISDMCSTPCCGCPELEFVTSSLKVLEATTSNLQSYANQLSERISNFVTSFVLTVGAA